MNLIKCLCRAIMFTISKSFLCSAVSLSRWVFVSAPIITTTTLICNFHGTRAGAGQSDGGQTLRGDRDLLFCRPNWKRGRDGSCPFLWNSPAWQTGFPSLNRKSVHQQRAGEGGRGGDEVCTDSRQQGGQSVRVDRIDEDQMNVSMLMTLEGNYA